MEVEWQEKLEESSRHYAYYESSQDMDPPVFTQGLSHFPAVPQIPHPQFNMVTLLGVTRMYKSFVACFGSELTYQNWSMYTELQKNAIATDSVRLYCSRWVARMMVDPEVPITINLILFLLDL